MATTHIIGGGLAGLAAAVRLCAAGQAVRVYEATAQAGGRCRSFYSDRLDRMIDNGSHMILGANHSAMEYIRMLNVQDRFIRVDPPHFPFVDVATHEQWHVRPEKMIPFGPWRKNIRIPATRPKDYLEALFYMFAGPNNTVTGTYHGGPGFYRRFIGPLCFAALNTHPREASAKLLWKVINDVFLSGGKASVAWMAEDSLTHALIDPALERIRITGGEIVYQRRLRSLQGLERVTSLDFTEGMVEEILTDDTVIIATTPWVAADLLPRMKIPQQASPIVNVHYVCPELTEPMRAAGIPFIGAVGGRVHWLFFRDDVVSVTASAADDLVDHEADVVAGVLWQEIRKIYNLYHHVPPCHVIKEKRATLKTTPMVHKLRPGTETYLKNCYLAGDYVQTGLPMTIDSAIMSGFRAADKVLGR